MRDYEVVYIFKSVLGTEDIEARIQSYHEKILAGPNAEITAIVHWGKRELAYPINKDKSGYYVVAQFSAPPEVLTGFERALKLDDDLIRHLVVISEGELPTPPSDIGGGHDRDGGRSESDDDDMPRRGRRDDDDDEDRKKPDSRRDDDDDEERKKPDSGDDIDNDDDEGDEDDEDGSADVADDDEGDEDGSADDADDAEEED